MMVVAAAATAGIIVCILFTGGYGLLSSSWAEETSVIHARMVIKRGTEVGSRNQSHLLVRTFTTAHGHMLYAQLVLRSE